MHPAVTSYVQRSRISSHVSVVQTCSSSHTTGETAELHVPVALHSSSVQNIPSSQLAQSAPASPHCAAVSPDRQRMPSQHPVQHRVERHLPAAPAAVVHMSPSISPTQGAVGPRSAANAKFRIAAL
jgi:hypothetical protein